MIQHYKGYAGKFKLISTYRAEKSLFENFFIYIYALGKLVFELSFDKNIKILHIHGASKGSFYRKYIIFFIGKYIFSKRVIYHIHGGGYLAFYNQSNRLLKKHIARFLRGADLVICLSESWKSAFAQHFNLDNIVVLANPIDQLTFFDKKKNEQVIFLFLGDIIKKKGIYDLLEAVKDLTDVGIAGFKLLIAGKGNTKKVTKYIEENALQEQVQLLGWIDGAIKTKVMETADVFVLPSYYEGLPLSILEAMSYSMPVISTTVGAIPEVVKERANGFLVDPGDKKMLRIAMLHFINNKELIASFGRLSRKRAEPYFIENVMKSLFLLYRNNLYDVTET